MLLRFTANEKNTLPRITAIKKTTTLLKITAIEKTIPAEAKEFKEKFEVIY